MSFSEKVTVAIPVHNGEAHVAEAIASIQAQTVAPTEVRVFDNASTDATVAIAQRLLGDDSVTRHPANIGAAQNFNHCVENSTGDYFMWLAADDKIRPEFIETCLRVLEQNPDAAACLTGIQFTDSIGRPTRTQTDVDLGSPEPRTRFRSFVRRRRWTETYCLYRRAHLLASPMFTTEYGTDVLLTWWLLLRGPLAVTSEILLEYREYPLGTVADIVAATAAGLDPQAESIHWRKIRMFAKMRQMSRTADLDPAVGRAARREIRRLALWPGAAFFVLDDVLERWPAVDRTLRRVWKRLGSPGQIAPTA